MEPRWLVKARGYIGQREIAGSKHNATILKWWREIKSQFKDDETPWCAAFVGGVLEECGIESTHSGMARSYESWGVPLSKPSVGAVVTFARKGGGHVGFVVGHNADTVSVLGGNQRDAVSISRFAKNGSALKVTAYRWPKGEPRNAELIKDVAAEDGGKVTLIGQPDDPGVDGEVKPTGPLGRIMQWFNAIGTGLGVIVASIADNWKTAAVIVAGGLIVFCIIWFTTKRGKA